MSAAEAQRNCSTLTANLTCCECSLDAEQQATHWSESNQSKILLGMSMTPWYST